jgi:hypothetical protein
MVRMLEVWTQFRWDGCSRGVGVRWVISFAVVAAALLPNSVASAKHDFAPGDVRLCNDRVCVGIVDRSALVALIRFYYSGPAPAEVRAPRLGAPRYALEFRGGYITGIAASAQLDRFRSGGVNMAQFGPGSWYRIPPDLAQSLRRLAGQLRPMHVTTSTIGRTRYG